MATKGKQSREGIVSQHAKAGSRWALRLQAGDPWSSLSKNQKRSARQAGIVPPPVGGLAPGVQLKTKEYFVASAPTIAYKAPRIRSQGKRTTVTRSELLASIKSDSSVGFNVRKWTVNPSDAGTFDWLVRFSAGFDMYRFTSLQVRYTAVTNTGTSGRVILAWSPDSSDSVPSSLSELYEYQVNKSSNVFEPCGIDIPCDGKDRFRRDGSNDDPKLVDFGAIYCLDYGAPDGTLLGEVHINYTIAITCPKNYASSLQVGLGNSSSGPNLWECAVTDAQVVFTLHSTGNYVLAVHIDGSVTDGPTTSGFTNVSTVGSLDPEDKGGTWINLVSAGTRGGTITFSKTGVIAATWYATWR
nr:coat protein [Hibiscus betacarmovirus]